MKRFFLYTLLLNIFLLFSTAYGEQSTNVDIKSSTASIRQHKPKEDVELLDDYYEEQLAELADLYSLWNLLEILPEDFDLNLIFDYETLKDDSPMQFEATISTYDPTNPKNTTDDEKLFWETFLDTLMQGDDTFDLSVLDLDSDSLKILMNDWEKYIDYLVQEFSKELNEFTGRESINQFMFESVHEAFKKELEEKNITSMQELVENFSQLDQQLLLACLDDMTSKLEEKILSNVDEEELLNSYLELLDEFSIDEDIDKIESKQKKEEDETFLNAFNMFENNPDCDISKLEEQLDNFQTTKTSSNQEAKNMSQKSKINSHIYSCFDLNNKPDLCKDNDHCMYIPHDTSNSDLGQCKLDPLYMEHLVDTGCKKEVKADLLSVARDLQSEGIFDNSILNFLRTVQDHDYLCRTITYSYFGNLNSAQSSDYNAAQWNSLKPQEKLDLILEASEEM